MMSLEQSLTLLNKKQLKAVTELNNNILLLASAGTGKTNVIAYRIANIIDKHKAHAEEILCLTFTNRACKEMQERIISIVGKNGLKITVKTFHSFCYHILRAEQKSIIDISNDFIIFDEEDCKEIINKLNNYGYNIKALQNTIDYIKQQRIVYDSTSYLNIIKQMKQRKLEKLRSYCVNERYQCDNDMVDYVLSHGHELLTDYDKVLSEQHGLDFNDLLIIVNDLFKNNMLLKRWREKYKFIHIDEVQDTSEVEYSIISKIFKANTIMISGDYFQTIYEWRGSNPQKVIQRFSDEYNPISIIFEVNYRATQKLQKASFGYLENTFKYEVAKIYHEEIVPKSKEPGKDIVLKSAYDIQQEARWIYDKIVELNVDDISKIAILTRNNHVNHLLSDEFERINKTSRRQLDFMLVDDFKFFRRQEIKDILAYLKFIINKHDTNSIKRIILRFAQGIGQRTVDAIESRECKALGINLTDFLDACTHIYGDPYYPLCKQLLVDNIILFDVESTGVSTSDDEIVQIAAIRINSKGEVINKFVEFIKPTKPVGTSEFIHGFSDAFLQKNGLEPHVALKKFGEFIKGSVLVGHNVNYDISILTSEMARLGLEKPDFKGSFDTMDLSRRFYPELPNHKLETICTYMHTEVKSDHNALNDILATKEILITIIKSNIKPKLKERMDVFLKYRDKFTPIYISISKLCEKSFYTRPDELVQCVIEYSGIKALYQNEAQRVKNIEEFHKIANSLDSIEQNCRDALIDLLKVTSLSNSELDRIIEKKPRIPIITVHQSKGAEFDYVFVAGLQEYTFPSYPAIKENHMAEEQRAFYVAMTRAKKQLFLSWSKADSRGEKQRCRFIAQIPSQYIIQA